MEPRVEPIEEEVFWIKTQSSIQKKVSKVEENEESSSLGKSRNVFLEIFMKPKLIEPIVLQPKKEEEWMRKASKKLAIIIGDAKIEMK